jgi:hypothetical protein
MADQQMSPEQATKHLLARRKVRRKLAGQPNINMYWDSLHDNNDNNKRSNSSSSNNNLSSLGSNSSANNTNDGDSTSC